MNTVTTNYTSEKPGVLTPKTQQPAPHSPNTKIQPKKDDEKVSTVSTASIGAESSAGQKSDN
jgi:hypothetical protein